MNRSTARLLIRLYPLAWRERYGEEFEALLETSPGTLRIAANIFRSALRELMAPTQGVNMNRQTSTFGTVLKEPIAFMPIWMSLVALGLVLAHVATLGPVPGIDQGDEHLWQLLMAGQAPILAFFAIHWLPKAPKQTLYVLGLQAGAAFASLAAVFFFNLG